MSNATRLSLIMALALAAPAVAMPRNLKIGDPMPDLRLKDVDGAAIDSAAWRGKPGAWLFVSPEQKSSEQAMVDLQAALDTLVGADLAAVVITVDPVHAAYFRQYRSRVSFRPPVAIDLERDLYGQIGVIVFPTTLLFNKEGKLAHVLSGHTLEYRGELAARLSLLAGRISEDELQRRLTTTRPARDAARDRAERLCRSADVMLERGLAEQAAVELRKAIEAAPDVATGYVGLARLKLAAGDVAAAEALADDIAKRAPNDRQVKLIQGTIRFQQGRLDEADALLNEALLLNPDPARTRYWLGRVAEARGQPAAAAGHYRAALEYQLPELKRPATRPATAQR